MTDTYSMFYIGVNVFVTRDNKLLLGKRRNVYGDGTWALPGGHLEHGESMVSATARELLEETGLIAQTYSFVGVFNNPKNDVDKHYVQIGFVAEGIESEPELREPDKCYEWKWFDLNNLPSEIFNAHQPLIDQFLLKKVFQDS